MAVIKESKKVDFTAKDCVIEDGMIVDGDGEVIDVVKAASAIYGETPFKLTLSAAANVDRDISEYYVEDSEEDE